MAEVDFGDSELFQQLDDSAPPLPTHIRFTEDGEEQGETNRLEECDDYIQRLSEENQVLRRKLNILTRPSGITVEDVNIDGPVLQILYANNLISKQCRQEIEDCICSVILKHHKPGNEKRKSSFHIKPQSSAFAMDEDPQKLPSSSVRTTTEAFKVVGSVLYFTTFSVDKLGQPLVNESPQMTDGWDVPTYHQVFNQVIGTDGQEIEMKDKRPKSMCFNCGSGAHQMRDCPKPKDMAAINERRKEFNQNSNQVMQSNQRYHADEVEERFAKYKPGVMSEELLTALGIDGNTLPPLIYRMRQLGYPPGWLKEAEMENSGLSLYDGNVSNDGSVTDNSTTYDVSKLVDFPGFNVPTPHKMKDEFMQYGSIPMQSSHMKQNYAAYLSNNFPAPGATSNKRRHDTDSSPQHRKKTRSSPDRNSDRSSDMDIESDPGTPYYNPSADDFKFQPPLPPGSPGFSSPPPLPQGTPPATPTPPPLPKGTPPPTPTNGSPTLRGRNWIVVDETAEGAEDDLTLEELEEQQRLIWAALENADTATNSDCDTPALGTPAHGDTESEEVEEAMDTTKPVESCQSTENQREPSVQETFSESPGPIKVEDDSPQSPEAVQAQDDSPQSPPAVKSHDESPQSPPAVKSHDESLQSPPAVKSHDESPQSPDPVRCPEDNPQSPNADSSNQAAGGCASPQSVEKITAVPHRSKFAAGIVPFEDTPEFTEVAEATGTYLRIRDLLKGSPRSLAKKK
uniref:Zinc finger CCHC domain-containing protein 8 n=1 Tax=Acanthochromis polyacanthus TaxID=80966 RepID=A0A3Q1F304_9TELE